MKNKQIPKLFEKLYEKTKFEIKECHENKILLEVKSKFIFKVGQLYGGTSVLKVDEEWSTETKKRFLEISKFLNDHVCEVVKLF